MQKKHGQRTKSPMHRKPYNRGDLFRKYVKSLRTEIIKGGQGKQRLALADSCTTPRTTDTRWLNPLFFAAQVQTLIPNKYLGFGYEALIFVEIMVD